MMKELRRAQVLTFCSRLPPCLVGLEACATAHYWGRELRALGHEVRLMPAQYVKAYIKRNKHDAADAEAICEAVQRPTMRFVLGGLVGGGGVPRQKSLTEILKVNNPGSGGRYVWSSRTLCARMARAVNISHFQCHRNTCTTKSGRTKWKTTERHHSIYCWWPKRPKLT